MKNKIIPIILIFIMCLSTCVVQASSTTKRDMSEEEFFNILEQNGYTIESNSINDYTFIDCSKEGFTSRLFGEDYGKLFTSYLYNSTVLYENQVVVFFPAFGDYLISLINYPTRYSLGYCDKYMVDLSKKTISKISSDAFSDDNVPSYFTLSEAGVSEPEFVSFDYARNIFYSYFFYNAYPVRYSNSDSADDNKLINEVDPVPEIPDNGDSDTDVIIPDYDYSDNNYINRNKPYFNISNLDGFVTNVETKPNYITDSYKGKYYFNLPFYIFNDPNSTYDFTHYTLRVGLYKPNISGDKRAYTILDYFDSTAGAVYISGDTGTNSYNGYDKYLYDVFSLINYNGQIDSYIDEYGKNGLAFQLFLYSPFNDQITKSSIITLNGDLTEHEFDNNIDNNLIFKENDDFLGLLESSKSFISHFLSFFDMFPAWLTTLIATAITVAIVCRLIGR